MSDRSSTSWGRPRPRGGGPLWVEIGSAKAPSSPPTRGWSSSRTPPPGRMSVVPAHAGVVPCPAASPAREQRRPRPRGGGPLRLGDPRGADPSSPPTRGWSRGPGGFPHLWGVVPAHAGVVRTASRPRTSRTRRPRPRGGGPLSDLVDEHHGVSSPPTRGWSTCPYAGSLSAVVVPAHAGVVPPRQRPHRPRHRRPRPRGGGPRPLRRRVVRCSSSPPTRGWSPRRRDPADRHSVVPAHAGVVPPVRAVEPAGTSRPRPRGGGPSSSTASRLTRVSSPPTRGWSRVSVARSSPRSVVPAHAGVVPSRMRRPQRSRGRPRPRGGGPQEPTSRSGSQRSSPPTRGWSPAPDSRSPTWIVVPAHAGVVPFPRSPRRSPGGRPRPRGGGPRSAPAESWSNIVPAHAGEPGMTAAGHRLLAGVGWFGARGWPPGSPIGTRRDPRSRPRNADPAPGTACPVHRHSIPADPPPVPRARRPGPGRHPPSVEPFVDSGCPDRDTKCPALYVNATYLLHRRAPSRAGRDAVGWLAASGSVAPGRSGPGCVEHGIVCARRPGPHNHSGGICAVVSVVGVPRACAMPRVQRSGRSAGVRNTATGRTR